MKQLWSLSLAILLVCTMSQFSGCNPFVSQTGRLDQPCFADQTCRPGLHCVSDVCLAVVPNDGGSDGDDDGGDGDDCSPDTLDCSGPDIAGQGPDEDGDGWGSCCDCDDDRTDTHPQAVETPYNGHDDDCDPDSPDDDLDSDGYSATQAGGDDCDDSNNAIYPDASEQCNGLDDDCDGQTDEQLIEQPCPLINGVCQGATTQCDGVNGWTECVYGPDYEVVETSCDQLDNDCDGETDNGVPMLYIPEQGAQASDEIDNNCNGLIDEPGGLVVPLHNFPNMWIDAYEVTVFENPDCTGQRYGLSSDDYPLTWPTEGFPDTTLYACSLHGMIPSGHLSYNRAKWACEAQGKRLCTRNQWENACNEGVNLDYPYSVQYVPGACNDPLAGTGQVEPTGSFEDCTTGNGTYDMSGNLAEWIGVYCDDAPGTAASMGDKYDPTLCIDGANCVDGLTNPDWVELLKIHSMCYVRAQHKVCYFRNVSEPYLGTRCCMDGP